MASKSKGSNAGEREWRGIVRKVTKGYKDTTDTPFEEKGLVIGLKAYLDENRYLTGLAPILRSNGERKYVYPSGKATDLELKW